MFFLLYLYYILFQIFIKVYGESYYYSNRVFFYFFINFSIENASAFCIDSSLLSFFRIPKSLPIFLLFICRELQVSVAYLKFPLLRSSHTSNRIIPYLELNFKRIINSMNPIPQMFDIFLAHMLIFDIFNI